MTLRIGPLPSSDALGWIENTRRLIAVVSEATNSPFALPAEVAGEMDRLLAAWQRRPRESVTFRWTCVISTDHLKYLLIYWFNIANMTDQHLDQVSATWSSARGERFHSAVLTSVLEQLSLAEPVFVRRFARQRSSLTSDATTPVPALH